MNQIRHLVLRLAAASCVSISLTHSLARQPDFAETLQLGLRGVYFVPNEGQWSNPDVAFGYVADELDVAFRTSSMTMHLARLIRPGDSIPTRQGDGSAFARMRVINADTPNPDGTSVAAWENAILAVTFPGSKDVTPVGAHRQAARFNYFVGGDSRSRARNIASFAQVVYENLYDGVDLHVMGNANGILKYEFHVAPGADASQISIAYQGVDSLCIDSAGNLHINTKFGTLTDAAPLVWQRSNAGRTPVPARFELQDDHTYRIALDGPVDPAHELILDPDVDWMTYLGGSDEDAGYRVALDGDDNAYVAGNTFSTDFEGRTNEHHGTHPKDIYVAKVNAFGVLQWVTYLGGSAYDEDFGIAMDGLGNAYVTGNTVSTDFDGKLNEHHGGTDDAFVVKVNPSGAVEWMTFLGGTSTDYGFGITLDAAGNCFVAGRSRSIDVEGRTNDHHGGVHDAIVFKVSPAGAVQWATYLGGNGIEPAVGIDLDSQGNCLVSGNTSSTDFEGSNNAYHGGSRDAFIAKLNPSGSIQWATYLGGSGREENFDLVVNAADDVFMPAYTDSPDFEGRNNAYQFEDGALVRVSASGALQWMTYLGGSDDDGAIGIALDAAGDPLISGYTYSADFPGRTNEHRGVQDAFIAKVSASGVLAWATFIGGSRSDDCAGVTLNTAGDAFISGSTQSSDFEGATNAYHGGGDAFVAKVILAQPPVLTVTATCPTGGPIQIAWNGATGGGTIVLLYARNTGSFRIPNGNPCAGTALGLGSNQLQNAYQGAAGQNGSRNLNSSTGPGACGGYLQLLDVASCMTSNVVRIE